MNRAWYWRQPQEYRREHAKCCIAEHLYCPVCRDPDPNCDDICGCYERDPEAWRKASWERQVEVIPELAEA